MALCSINLLCAVVICVLASHSYVAGQTTVIVTPSNSTLREGESITISCSYSGVDIDSVNWILMNRTLRTSTFSDAASGSGAPVNTTGSLNLTIMVTADQSVLQYTCSVTSGVSMVTANVTIEILAIPDPLLSTDRRGYNIGDTVNITCSAVQTTPPIIDITILSPDNAILLTGVQSVVNGTATSTLTITNISQTSFGEYVCLVHSTAGLNTTGIRLRERGYIQVNLLYRGTNPPCEEYKQNDTAVKFTSIEARLAEIITRECNCDFSNTDIDSSSSLFICSTEGRTLTYRAALDYSSQSGDIVSSTLLRELQLYFYRSTNRDFNISGTLFTTVVECPVAITSLTAVLCPDPVNTTCYVYNDPLIYGLTLGGALILGCVLGAAMSCAFCGCVNCCRCGRDKNYPIEHEAVVLSNENNMELAETNLIEEASDTEPENEPENTAMALSGTQRSASFSAPRRADRHRWKNQRAGTVHLSLVSENQAPTPPRSPRPIHRQSQQSALSLPLPAEPPSQPPQEQEAPAPTEPATPTTTSAITPAAEATPPTVVVAPVPKKRTRTATLSISSISEVPSVEPIPEYHRRTATLPLPKKSEAQAPPTIRIATPPPQLQQEPTYMEVVAESEMQTADTAALVVVDEHQGSQELPQIYDDIGGLDMNNDSPDMTQFDDIITPAKSLPPPSQDDVYI